MDQLLLDKLYDVIENNLQNEQFGVVELARESGLSQSQLNRKLNAITGKSANQIIREYRLKKAMGLLQADTATAAEVSYLVGFGSPSYFNTCFHDFFGYTPGEVKIRGQIDKKRRPSAIKKMIILTFTLAIFFLLIYTVIDYFSVNKYAYNKKSEKSIAVLPFIDLSPEGDLEYFGDGIAEEIIISLTQIKDLKVIGRTSSFQFKGEKIDLRDIGKKLHVSTILEGSVMKSGNRLRISAKLINVSDGSQLWANQYDKDNKDIFAIQDDISLRITELMKLTIIKKEQRSFQANPTDNMEAYEQVLRGKYFIGQRLDGVEKAIPYFSKAIELDPKYAEAYSGLAYSYIMGIIYKLLPIEDGFKKAKEMLDMSIKLDPTLAYTHKNLALYFLVTWQWENIMKEYKIAIDLGSAPDMTLPAYLMYVTNKFDDAINEAKLVIENDPLSVEKLIGLSRLYLMTRRYVECRDICSKTLELNSSNSELLRYIGLSYFHEGEYEIALSYFKKADEIFPAQGYSRLDYYITLAAMNERDQVEKYLSELISGVLSNNNYNFEIAYLYIYLGNIDEAFVWLNQAYEKREFWLFTLKVDPIWDPIRSDPRFLQLLERMKFPK